MATVPPFEVLVPSFLLTFNFSFRIPSSPPHPPHFFFTFRSFLNGFSCYSPCLSAPGQFAPSPPLHSLYFSQRVYPLDPHFSVFPLSLFFFTIYVNCLTPPSSDPPICPPPLFSTHFFFGHRRFPRFDDRPALTIWTPFCLLVLSIRLYSSPWIPPCPTFLPFHLALCFFLFLPYFSYFLLTFFFLGLVWLSLDRIWVSGQSLLVILIIFYLCFTPQCFTFSGLQWQSYHIAHPPS